MDCLIVGAGLIGMLTARELSQAGLHVMLLDRGRAGSESSWAGGGILSPLYPWRYSDVITDLAAWSQRRYPDLAGELCEATGVDPEWTASGMLILERHETDKALAWAAAHDVMLEIVDKVVCRSLEPALGEIPEQALWLPQVAQVRNPRLIKALRSELVGLGISLCEGEEVVSLRQKKGRIRGVCTRSGMCIEAELMVVASGAWSGQILETLGIALPVYPVRGQMLLLRCRPGQIRRIVMLEGRYVIPRRDGHVLVGSSVEEVGFDKGTTAEVREELWSAARGFVPALARCVLLRHWAGLRPGTGAGVPFIGPVPHLEGLFVNCGHFRNGVVLGPASARLLADLVLGRTPIVNPDPYAVTRRGEVGADFLSV